MKFKTLAATIAAVTLAPLAANAGVTVTPLLLGYQYTDMESTNDAQRKILRTGKNLNVDKDGAVIDENKTKVIRNGGISKKSGLYTGAAVGIELTPNTQFQVEYGVSNTQGHASKRSAQAGVNRFDVEQQSLTGNLLVGANTSGNLKPYVLVGAGQSQIEVSNQEAIKGEINGVQVTQYGNDYPANTVLSDGTDTIGNLGLGALYRVNDSVSLRGEGRAVHNFNHDWWEGMAVAGLEVVLGGHLGKPVVAPVAPVAPVEVLPETPKFVETPEIVVVEDTPVDSDADGVYDNQDACPGTPSNIVVDARGCPQQVNIAKDWKMELRIFFDNDKTVIKDQYQPEIAKVAEVMTQYPASKALIEGHASKTGPSARYNQRLSEARAVAVKSVLTNEYGVTPNRLATQGFGYDRPIAPNDTAEGRAMNRRVYAVIDGQKTVTVEKTKNMR